MKIWISALAVSIAVAIVGHFTQWFGFTKPAIDSVRREANEKIVATNERVDETEKRTAVAETKLDKQDRKIEALDARTTSIESASRERDQKVETLDARVASTESENQIQNKQLDALKQQTSANTQELAEVKARMASGGAKSAVEIQLERDLIDAMTRMSEVKVAFAESFATEGRVPASNAQIGLPAPDKFASGALRRVAVENGSIVAYFDAHNPNPNPRLKLVAVNPNPNVSQAIRWQCQTNMPIASRMFLTCELKTSL